MSEFEIEIDIAVDKVCHSVGIQKIAVVPITKKSVAISQIRYIRGSFIF
jgi:hypothetical protein